jgi:hypothetical protein
MLTICFYTGHCNVCHYYCPDSLLLMLNCYNTTQATGLYSGFIASEASNTGTNNASIGSSSAMSAAMPSGTMSAGAGGGGGGGAVATDQETFG